VLIAAATMVVVVLGSGVPVRASSVLEGRLAERATVSEAIASLRSRRVETASSLRTTIGRTTEALRQMPRGRTANPERYAHVHRRLLRDRRAIERRLDRSIRAAERRVRTLQLRRRSIDTWLDTWGVFERCPIDGPHVIDDDFGVMVRLPGVPVHRHEGNDIVAAIGTPIVAPFDGVATPSRSELGGLEVTVTGPLGSVYNAHLSALGTLGEVPAGTVVGYVGDTGDATAPHDHLEWHPLGGPAVDPYPYLVISCG
jgi:hypothetical protein